MIIRVEQRTVDIVDEGQSSQGSPTRNVYAGVIEGQELSGAQPEAFEAPTSLLAAVGALGGQLSSLINAVFNQQQINLLRESLAQQAQPPVEEIDQFTET